MLADHNSQNIKKCNTFFFSFWPTDLPYAMPRASILKDVSESVRTPIGDRADGSYSSEEE